MYKIILFLAMVMAIASLSSCGTDHSKKKVLVHNTFYTSDDRYQALPGTQPMYVDTMYSIGDTVLDNGSAFIVAKD